MVSNMGANKEGEVKQNDTDPEVDFSLTFGVPTLPEKSPNQEVQETSSEDIQENFTSGSSDTDLRETTSSFVTTTTPTMKYYPQQTCNPPVRYKSSNY